METQLNSGLISVIAILGYVLVMGLVYSLNG